MPRRFINSARRWSSDLCNRSNASFRAMALHLVVQVSTRCNRGSLVPLVFAKPYAGPATPDIRMTILVGSFAGQEHYSCHPPENPPGSDLPESGREAGAAS